MGRTDYQIVVQPLEMLTCCPYEKEGHRASFETPNFFRQICWSMPLNSNHHQPRQFEVILLLLRSSVIGYCSRGPAVFIRRSALQLTPRWPSPPSLRGVFYARTFTREHEGWTRRLSCHPRSPVTAARFAPTKHLRFESEFLVFFRNRERNGGDGSYAEARRRPTHQLGLLPSRVELRVACPA